MHLYTFSTVPFVWRDMYTLSSWIVWIVAVLQLYILYQLGLTDGSIV